MNHSIEFMKNEDRTVHTQTSKWLWILLKLSIKREGRPRKHDEIYLFKYNYFHSLKLRGIFHPKHQLSVFLHDIARVYTGYGKHNLLLKPHGGGKLQDCEDK